MGRSMVSLTAVVATAAFLASGAYAKKSVGANALNDSSKIHACVGSSGNVKILYVPGVYGSNGDTCGGAGAYFEWSPTRGRGGTARPPRPPGGARPTRRAAPR